MLTPANRVTNSTVRKYGMLQRDAVVVQSINAMVSCSRSCLCSPAQRFSNTETVHSFQHCCNSHILVHRLDSITHGIITCTASVPAIRDSGQPASWQLQWVALALRTLMSCTPPHMSLRQLLSTYWNAKPQRQLGGDFTTYGCQREKEKLPEKNNCCCAL